MTDGPDVAQTESIRHDFVYYQDWQRAQRGVEFDTWLAQIRAEAWAEGLQVGWEATSDRTHYDSPTGFRDLPRYLKKRNPHRKEQ